jgi:hypothetical protein
MPENELSLVKMPAGLRSNLTAREKRDLEKAEGRIARGLKSFLAVGMALKEIRDNRLYREDFKTFEEYCARRWDFTRIRAYQICAASEVVADLSTIVNIPLPENEAQARPMVRLKTTQHRRRAWRMALKMASAEGRPVTARDAEEAVNLLSETIEPTPVNGVPIYHSSEGIRAAYCDPPYVNQARRRYDCPEIDHRALIARLQTFDAWALSLSSPSLRQVLPLCPDGVRVGAWVKPWCAFRPNVNPSFAWEPVIFKLGRQRTRQQPTIRDWHSANMTMERGLCGVKPESFCFWIFEMLNLQPGDSFYDLFEGSGAVTRAFRRWMATKSPLRSSCSKPG